MHISDGILSMTVIAAGAGLTVAGTYLGLKKLKYEDIPGAAVMASAFFTASLIHVPAGPVSVHLILNGLVGLVVGYAAFPVILTALFLQVLFFGYGGYVSLGVNTFNMAFPAVLCFWGFSYLVNITRRRELLFVFGFLCGFISVALSAILVFLSLGFSGPGLKSVSFLVLTSHVPVMFIEGIITGCVAVFIKKVRPDLFKTAERGGFSLADTEEYKD